MGHAADYRRKLDEENRRVAYDLLAREAGRLGSQRDFDKAGPQATRRGNTKEPRSPASASGVALTGHTGSVYSVAWSPDSKRLASGASVDKTVRVWDADKGQETLTLKGHTSFVWSVAWSPDGKRLASGGNDNTVKVWDAATGAPWFTFKDTGWVFSVAWSPDGQYLASGGHDETVKVWRVK